MKKFAFLILSVLLFAGCNNMLTNPNAFNVEDAHVSIDVSQIQARNAGAGNVITSTLDFVGEEPKHAPFEKTQTVSGGTIDYTIKGLPVGATVQFKLSVFRNGLLLCEGISKKITIKEKNALSILLNKKNNWIILPLSVYSNGEILESKTYNVDLSASKIDYDMVNKTLPPYSCFCTDDKGNVYFATLNENQGNEIIRCTLPYVGDQVTLVNLGSSIKMKYDVSTDTLYYLDSANQLYSVPKASTTSKTEPSDSITLECLTIDTKFAIYNGYLYYIEYNPDNNSHVIHRQPLNPEVSDKPMILFQVEEGENVENGESNPTYSGVIAEQVKETFNDCRFNVEITDLAVTNEGVFVLLRDHTYMIQNVPYNATRGGIVKIDHNLTSANLYGWTKTKQVIIASKKADDSNPEGSSFTISQYMPENISAGFYGPDKIVAIRPKKLVFTDYGAWAYIDGTIGLTQNLKKSKNLIIFDLEECTWTSQKITLDLSEAFFPSASFVVCSGPDYSYSVNWQ